MMERPMPVPLDEAAQQIARSVAGMNRTGDRWFTVRMLVQPDGLVAFWLVAEKAAERVAIEGRVS